LACEVCKPKHSTVAPKRELSSAILALEGRLEFVDRNRRRCCARSQERIQPVFVKRASYGRDELTSRLLCSHGEHGGNAVREVENSARFVRQFAGSGAELLRVQRSSLRRSECPERWLDDACFWEGHGRDCGSSLLDPRHYPFVMVARARIDDFEDRMLDHTEPNAGEPRRTALL
jgi:hypothetical protein